MDSSILRWLLLITAVVALCIWYLHYQISLKRKRSAPQSEHEQTSQDVLNASTGKESSVEEANLMIVSIGNRENLEFSGKHVVDLLVENGLVAGKFSIYHRYIQAKGESQLVYSVINGIEPGYLDDAFVASSTPSIMFFFDVSTSYNPTKAFDQMLETAQNMASQLGGMVYDKDFSVMTGQTITYLRETIREKERSLRLSENM